MARIGDERISVHRSAKVFRAYRGDDLQANHDRDSTTSGRVAGAEGGHQQSRAGQSVAGQLSPVLLQQGPLRSAGRGRVQGMQSVFFDHRVTVFPADNYDRSNPWMRMAIERAISRRRK